MRFVRNRRIVLNNIDGRAGRKASRSLSSLINLLACKINVVCMKCSDNQAQSWDGMVLVAVSIDHPALSLQQLLQETRRVGIYVCRRVTCFGKVL